MSIVSESNLSDVFSYHAPSAEDLLCYQALRTAAADFAHAIITNCPVCGDQQAALRKVREALMTANASIALKGKI